jgi:GTPase SAR1 family protein
LQPARGASLNSFELNRFRAWKNHISTQLDLLAGIAGELHAEPIASELEKTKRDMDAESFRFVVVGEFSRGKSTVINALLADRLLPASVEPTTTVLTKIKGGATRSFKLYYRDGRADENISAEQFKTLVAPPEPAQRDKEQRRLYEQRQTELRSLAMVEITHPGSLCDEGVEIVDTPGTNDLDPLREQITYDYIPRADAILFVLTARQALTQSESDFLQNRVLTSDVARIFFLLNYADTLSPVDLTTVQNKCVLDLARFVSNPKLYPVSAKKALAARTSRSENTSAAIDEGGFVELERALASFLESERARAKLSRPVSRGIRVCEELLAGPVAMARSTIGLDIPELRKRIDDLSPKIQIMQERRNRTLTTLKLRLESRKIALAIRMREGLYKVADAALNAVDGYDGPISSEELGRHIEAQVAPVQSEFQSTFKAEAAEAFSAEFTNIEGELSSSQADLQALFEKDGASVAIYFPSEQPTIDGGGLGTFLQIGGAGIGLLFLPFFAPLALIAGWFGGAFTADWIEQGARREKLGEIRNAVDERYRGTISDSVSHFEMTWQVAVQSALKSLAADFDRRCSEARTALETALANLTNASRTASQLSADMNGLEARILAVKQSLLNEGFPQ